MTTAAADGPGAGTGHQPARGSGAAPRGRDGPAVGPGGQVTLKDVAACAGVHPSTASRALRPGTRDMVREATAARVLRVAASLGYVRNQVAVSLRTRSSRTVGVLVPDQSDPAWARFARGVEDQLGGAGYMVLVCSTDADSGRQQRILTQMTARHIDGLIAAGVDLPAAAGRSGLPVITVGLSPPAGEAPAVRAHLAEGARMIVRHLAVLGHRSIGCITGPGSGPGICDLTAALTERGLEVHQNLMLESADGSAGEGARCCTLLLARSPSCTAVITGSDLLAAGCCQALTATAWACPRDMSVTGWGDLPLAACLTPPLTTIRPPHYQIGIRAACLLAERISGAGHPAAPQLLIPELVTRASTGPVTITRTRAAMTV